ncbi:MAG: DinB family protein [Pseudomonadota bacterium]
MITADFCRTMARYNRWQNQSIYAAAGGLGDAARRADRGAFFGSIHGTLSHLLWGDGMWMSRFDGGGKPPGGIPDSAALYDDWAELSEAREEMDARILDWSGPLTDAEVEGQLRWYSGALGADVERPLALCVTHFFNHQTHHRGQVHAMLTAAGASPADTDLFVMPTDA